MFDVDLNIHHQLSATDVLVSEPFLGDANFDRSVIVVCEHQRKGSFGLVLNRPTDTMLSEALTWPEAHDFTIFSGGPVERNSLYFIHSFPEVSHSLPLKNGLYLGGEFATMRSIASEGRLSAQNCRFFAGYSGWSEKQLESEIKRDAWIIAKNLDLSQLLCMPTDNMWRDVLRSMGGRYRIFSHYPEDPQLN